MKCSLLSGVMFSLVLIAAVPVHAAITISNQDGPGEGLNDPTAATPVGGNTGTTVGQQRLNAFNEAAAILNATFEINQTVVVNANFDELTCTTNSAVLGSA